MSKFLGVLSIIVVIVLAMGFAAANAGSRVTIDLGLFTLYQVPVTLVAFSGLFVGMVLMFITGVHTDLKVRRILRDRFAEESRQERTAIDRNQKDLFGADADSDGDPIDEGPPQRVVEGSVPDDPGAGEESGPINKESHTAEAEEPSEPHQIE